MKDLYTKKVYHKIQLIDLISMIEALYKLGESWVQKHKFDLDKQDDIINILIEDPAASNKYKHVIAIEFNIENGEAKFKGINYEEYSKEKINQYLYKKGSPNGIDFSLTSRITESRKTFVNKISKWPEQILRGNIALSAEETKFIVSIDNVFKEKSELILSLIEGIRTNFKKDEYSILTCIFYDKNGSKMYIGDIDIFKKVLIDIEFSGYCNKYNKKSISKNQICSVCKTKKDEVYGFVSPYNFYTVDKPGFVSGGLDQNNAWKNYPVCKKCALTLEAGKKYINDSFIFRFYDYKYFVIPKSLINDDATQAYEILEEFKNTDFSLKNEYVNLVSENTRDIFELLSNKPNKILNNILIYEEGQSEFKIQLYIEDIFPSRIREIIDAKKDIDKIGIFKEIKVDSYNNDKNIKIPLEFTFGTIWYFFNNKNNKDKRKYFLEIINCIFSNKRVDYQFILNGIMDKIRSQFVNGYSTEEASMRGLQVLSYLNKLKLLKDFREGEEMALSSQNEITREENIGCREKSEKIFSSFPDFFNSDAKRSVFLTGVLVKCLLDIQYQERGNKPFEKKLQGLKLDEKLVKKLFPEIINKLDEYDKNYYTDLERLISEYMIRSGSSWQLSKDEISFYFVVGMNQANKFKFGKNSEE